MPVVVLRGLSRRKWTRTTLRDGAYGAVRDLVERDLAASRSTVLWMADATYAPALAGCLFLAVVIDVYSRRMVGRWMGSRVVGGPLLEALDMVPRPARCAGHHPSLGSRPIHLDRGRQALPGPP